MGYSTVVNKTPLQLGIDYTGGTMLQYGFEKEITKTEEGQIRNILEKLGIDNAVIQTSAPVVEKTDAAADEAKADTTADKTAETKSTENANSKKQYVVSIRTRYLETTEDKSEAGDILNALKDEFGNVEVLQVNAIGPTLGKELYKNSLTVLILAFAGIIIYLTFRFQFDYALAAILGLVHDVLFIFGIFPELITLTNSVINS